MRSIESRKPVKRQRVCGNCISFLKNFPRAEVADATIYLEDNCSHPRGRRGPQKANSDCCNYHHFADNGF